MKWQRPREVIKKHVPSTSLKSSATALGDLHVVKRGWEASQLGAEEQQSGTAPRLQPALALLPFMLCEPEHVTRLLSLSC